MSWRLARGAACGAGYGWGLDGIAPEYRRRVEHFCSEAHEGITGVPGGVSGGVQGVMAHGGAHESGDTWREQRSLFLTRQPQAGVKNPA
ncbi:hypothetical protein KL86DES1_21187 [uncultured Desulfovibrio sp.]|uniref:Uncharacterized protein n=1 Tax=uncultured Desulfovibrio sp. TaxID=167968 RepID=A0A212L6S7_9BACT|nr:hypothetical protein KL86DES1_21187 [uncultured Desulfovibrio sp.]VZH34083.1 conserved protein of unknown function [Desulfovibrio sp. 86]